MEIKLDASVAPVRRGAVGKLPSRPPAARDSAQFDETEQLNRALQATPETRPDKVARAQELIGDVAYPPPETIRRLATLLALHLDEPSD